MNNDGGTMIGVNGGPMPEDNELAKANNRRFGPDDGVLQGVEGTLSKDWYEKKEPVKPRVYHKYYKGCQYKKDDPENPDTEDNTGSNTGDNPGGKPENPDPGKEDPKDPETGGGDTP